MVENTTAPKPSSSYRTPWDPWERWLRAQYGQTTTPHDYSWRSRKFREALGIETPEDIGKKITPAKLIEFFDEQKHGHQYGYAIIAFLDFHGRGDLARQVPTPRRQGFKIPRWMPEPVVTRVLVDDNAPDRRMAALCAVCYDLALRPNEALMLRAGPLTDGDKWLDLRSGVTRIFRLKTHGFPWQTHQLGKWAHEKVVAYAKERQPGEWIFQSFQRGGAELKYNTLAKAWEGWTEYLQIRAEFRILRHSKLTWMAVQGEDTVDIMRFAGHSSLSATSMYLHMGLSYRNNPLSTIEWMNGSRIYAEAVDAIGKTKVPSVSVA